jgi:hypothetical protein
VLSLAAPKKHTFSKRQSVAEAQAQVTLCHILRQTKFVNYLIASDFMDAKVALRMHMP